MRLVGMSVRFGSRCPRGTSDAPREALVSSNLVCMSEGDGTGHRSTVETTEMIPVTANLESLADGVHVAEVGIGEDLEDEVRVGSVAARCLGTVRA